MFQMDVEHGILSSMEKLLETVCSLSQCATSKLDEKSVEVCKELLQVGVKSLCLCARILNAVDDVGECRSFETSYF